MNTYPHYTQPYRGLPTEVRLLIWEYLIPLEAIFEMESDEDVLRDRSLLEPPFIDPQLTPGLCRVNRQVHEEIQPFFRSMTINIWSVDSDLFHDFWKLLDHAALSGVNISYEQWSLFDISLSNHNSHLSMSRAFKNPIELTLAIWFDETVRVVCAERRFASDSPVNSSVERPLDEDGVLIDDWIDVDSYDLAHLFNLEIVSSVIIDYYEFPKHLVKFMPFIGLPEDFSHDLREERTIEDENIDHIFGSTIITRRSG